MVNVHCIKNRENDKQNGKMMEECLEEFKKNLENLRRKIVGGKKNWLTEMRNSKENGNRSGKRLRTKLSDEEKC